MHDLNFRRLLSGSTESWRDGKATIRVLLALPGIKPALLVGERFDQHIEEEPDRGA